MLNWPAHLRVFVCVTPTDMRKQFDGLLDLVTSVFGRDVFEGRLFLFFNRRLDRVKALWWDRDGLAIFVKGRSAWRCISSPTNGKSTNGG